MVRRLKTARKSSVPQYRPQEDYYHYQSDDETEEVASEEEEEEQAQEADQGDHQDPVEELEEQAEAQGEPAEVVWTVSLYKKNGRDVSMANNLRRTVYRLAYG